MATETELTRSHTSTTVVAVLALIVSAVAAIPGFLGLNKEQASIYFSSEMTGIMVPIRADEPKVRNVLASNGIASDYLSIALVNQGNREAPEVRIAISLPGNIMQAWTDPPPSEKPIWVQLPDLSQAKGQQQLQVAVKSLVITKPVMLHFGFERKRDASASVDVFADGKPATRVENVATVPPWSPIDVFRIPLIVLGVGLAVVILWAIGVVLSKNPRVTTALKELVVKTALEFLKGVFPFARF